MSDLSGTLTKEGRKWTDSLSLSLFRLFFLPEFAPSPPLTSEGKMERASGDDSY